MQEFFHSARALRQSPLFAMVAVGTMALGIGATSALFSVVNASLWGALPIPAADRVFALREEQFGQSSGGNPNRLLDLAQAKSLAATAGVYPEDLTFQAAEGPTRVRAMRAYGDILGVIGLSPQIGRTWTRDEQLAMGEPVLLISSAFWARYLQKDPNVVGRQVMLNKQAFTIVGVLPAEGLSVYEADLLITAPNTFLNYKRTPRFLDQVARLAPGVSVEQAQAELTAIGQSLALRYPDSDKNYVTRLVPIAHELTQNLRTPLFLLWGVVGTVLLIACVNLAGLLLARGLARSREASIRAALGASQGRLILFYLYESVWIGLFGGGLGLLLSVVLIDFCKNLFRGMIDGVEKAALDGETLLFTVVLSAVSCLLFGLVPAWQVVRRASDSPLKQGSAGSIGAAQPKLRGALVVLQVGLACALLLVSLLLVQGLLQERTMRQGFVVDNRMSFAVNFAWDSDSEKTYGFMWQMLDRLQATPGVESAAVVDRLPLGGQSQSSQILVKGRTLPLELAQREISFRGATSQYFATIGAEMAQGELYRERQPEDQMVQVVLNQSLAQALFGQQNPIGELVASKPRDASQPRWMRVVGVVRDIRQTPLAMRPALEVYRPIEGTGWPMLRFVVRTPMQLDSFARTVRNLAREIDDSQIVEDLQSLDLYRQQVTRSPQQRTWLISAFAMVALLLAAIGLYGLLASEVARRRKEFAVRLALGASPHQLLRQALWSGGMLVLCGLVAGCAAGAYLAALLQGQLPGMAATNPVIYLQAMLVLFLVSLLALWIPARRASQVMPLEALRQD